MRFGVLFALAIALVLGGAPGLAVASGVETVELVYRAPADCPSEATFVSAVTRRAPRARFAPHAEGARRFVVDIRKQAKSFAGRLIIVEHGANQVTQELTTARCEALVDAFVFFTAIALDPAASGAPSSSSPSPPEHKLPQAAPSSPSPSAPSREHVPPSEPAPSSPTSSRGPPGTWRWSAGSGAYVATGIADAAMISAHPMIDAAYSAIGLSPSVRLGLLWSNSVSQPLHPGELTLGLRALVLSGCALHVRFLDGAVGLRACAALEGGVLAVRPFAVALPSSPDRPWFAAGPLLRVDVPLGWRMALGSDLGLLLPFEREGLFARAGSPTMAVVQPIGARFSMSIVLQGL